jgi:hypothetical protein
MKVYVDLNDSSLVIDPFAPSDGVERYVTYGEVKWRLLFPKALMMAESRVNVAHWLLCVVFLCAWCPWMAWRWRSGGRQGCVD